MPHSGGDDGQRGRPGVAQLARDQFALELDAGDEEEDREQPVGRPVRHGQVQAERRGAEVEVADARRSCRCSAGCSPRSARRRRPASSSTPPTVSVRSASATKFRSGRESRPRTLRVGGGAGRGHGGDLRSVGQARNHLPTRLPGAPCDVSSSLHASSTSGRRGRSDVAGGIARRRTGAASGTRRGAVGSGRRSVALGRAPVSPRCGAAGSLAWIRSITVESGSVVTSPSCAVLRDVAQQPPHDLAGAGLRQLGHQQDLLAAWRSGRASCRRGCAARRRGPRPRRSPCRAG